MRFSEPEAFQDRDQDTRGWARGQSAGSAFPAAPALGLTLALAFALVLAQPKGLAAGDIPTVIVDQVGYLPLESKLAMVTAAPYALSFTVLRTSDQAPVFRGTLGPLGVDGASGDRIRAADFSALTATGSYRVDVAGVGSSYPFAISTSAYAAAYVLASRGFYGQRCGTAVDMGVVDGVDYRHAECHVSGTAGDLPATFHPSSGRSGPWPSPKGWHDAGDYGKYVVNAGIATAQLLWTYEWHKDRVGDVRFSIPESGNGTPDLLNESRWELEWMLTMQDGDGGVWHKETSARFGGFLLPENDDAGIRYIIGAGPGDGTGAGKTSCSTADFAAVLAIAARLYPPFDPAFSAKCLEASKRAWDWVSAHPAVYYSQPVTGPAIVTGAYKDSDASDEMYWAAAELFRTTGAARYNAYCTAKAPAGTLVRESARPQDWGNVLNMGLWAYYFSGQPTANPRLRARIKADTVAAADSIAVYTVGESNGYRVSLGADQYIWGSNGEVANFGLLLLAADRMQPSPLYTRAALDDLHYLLGRNTWNLCFVTHLGSNPVAHPHHRPSASPEYRALAPWPGLMSGGPNATGWMSDHLTPMDLLHPARCYVDATRAYASNEIAINWQSALVFLLAAEQPDAGTPAKE